MKFWSLLGLVVLLIIVGAWAGEHFFNGWQRPQGASPYAAVYLSTGDIYFGKLTWSETPHMTGVWYLQKGAVTNGVPQYGISPFAAAFWGPIDEIYFNQSQIIFWTYLKDQSVVASALSHPDQLQKLLDQILQQGQQTPPSIPVPVTATSTSNATTSHATKK